MAYRNPQEFVIPSTKTVVKDESAHILKRKETIEKEILAVQREGTKLVKEHDQTISKKKAEIVSLDEHVKEIDGQAKKRSDKNKTDEETKKELLSDINNLTIEKSEIEEEIVVQDTARTQLRDEVNTMTLDKKTREEEIKNDLVNKQSEKEVIDNQISDQQNSLLELNQTVTELELKKSDLSKNVEILIETSKEVEDLTRQVEKLVDEKAMKEEEISTEIQSKQNNIDKDVSEYRSEQMKSVDDEVKRVREDTFIDREHAKIAKEEYESKRREVDLKLRKLKSMSHES